MLVTKGILVVLFDLYFNNALYYRLIFVITELSLYAFIMMCNNLFGIIFLHITLHLRSQAGHKGTETRF
jgi:hypothetical protein